MKGGIEVSGGMEVRGKERRMRGKGGKELKKDRKGGGVGCCQGREREKKDERGY